MMKASVCIATVGVFLVYFLSKTEAAFGFGQKDRVRLEDISVLTLHNGKMTTGSRSSPVKQLKCVGGSAANVFTPQVVQCYNRGSDGYDVQWECKSDMDNAYRFGQIEVVCEGYSSPDDEDILKGSCGLEYTLEYTKEGMQQKNSGGQYNSHYGNNDDGSYDNTYNNSRQNSSKTDWIFLAIVGVLMYVLYRTCIANAPAESGTTGTDDGYPGPRGTGFGPGGGGGGGGAAPPPGFRDNGNSGASCGGSQGYSSGASRGAGTGGVGAGGGGFWTGAAAGGLMGYLFGNGNRGYGGYGRPRYGYSSPRNTGFSSGWGSSSRSGGFGGFGGGGASSGTRTASGFGGTRRR